MDAVITPVCSEMLFGGGSCCVETGRLVCNAGQLMGFYMIPCFTKGNFRTDYNICSEMPFSRGSCRVEASSH